MRRPCGVVLLDEAKNPESSILRIFDTGLKSLIPSGSWELVISLTLPFSFYSQNNVKFVKRMCGMKVCTISESV